MNTNEIQTKPILMYLLQHFDFITFEMLLKFKSKLYIELKDYCCYWPLDKYSLYNIVKRNSHLFVISFEGNILRQVDSKCAFDTFDIRETFMPNEYINAILSIDLEKL